MNLRHRLPVLLVLLSTAGLTAAAPAAASTVAIKAPETAIVGKTVQVVYEGFGSGAGTTELTGTGPNMMLRAFMERNGSGCTVTSAEMRTRAKIDADQFIETPAPYSLTSNVTFTETGEYRFCAYLEVGLSGDTAPPAAFTQAVIRVNDAPKPCVVPKVTGATLATASTRLRNAGCTVGKVSRPKGVKRSAKLVVRSQSVEPTVVLASGFKVNLVMRKPGKKKR
jgi:hypothetical protein